MKSEGVVILNLLVAVLVIAIFFWGRKAKGPSRLNLSGGAGRSHSKGEKLGSKSADSKSFEKKTAADRYSDSAKALNILFDFKGRTYDAYQVLELPGGTSFQEVKEKYEALARTSSQKPELIAAAFEAIRKVS